MFYNARAACLVFSNSSFIQDTSLYTLEFKSLQVSEISYAAISQTECFTQETIYSPLKDNKPGIPISLVYKSSCMKDTALQRPLYMIAYGSYGGYQDPTFRSEHQILLDQGFIVAICHPRGDGDLGANWYTDGKYEKKENTFRDVEQCIHHLVDSGYAKPGKIAVKARSAGGLVAGNLINSFGDLAGGLVSVVITQVPFIDPIYDMIDVRVPWTGVEWYEWGDPNRNASILRAMKRYSPYHNVPSHGKLIPTFVLCGMNDARVPYWEPTKWIAKMREFKKSKTSLLLRVRDVGHFEAGEVDTLEMFTFLFRELNIV